ncbi:uncharacterized protein LOC134191206 [Corticium candelabrum]|uniref:uncharacterized protein LOC134191206 n=1 Tax=Corticium candelabrum TaxID=121492 RepID=UPI002E262A0F|nr:uncharacterized protein LOC134191206 [Corticium candelabrum]
MSRLSYYFLFLVAGLGYPVAWTPCLDCVANKRLCIASGTCGQCETGYVEVSNRCVGKDYVHPHLTDIRRNSQTDELLETAMQDHTQNGLSRSTDKDMGTVGMAHSHKEMIHTKDTTDSLSPFTDKATEIETSNSPTDDPVRSIYTTSEASNSHEAKSGTDNSQLSAAITQSREEISAPAAGVRDTVEAPAEGGSKGDDALTRLLLRPTSIEDQAIPSSMTEMTHALTGTNSSDGRIADVYLLVVIICSCVISIMGLIIAFLCWSKLKNQARRVIDSEYSYRHLPAKEDHNTVNGYTSAQQAELYMYNQKRQQIKSSHTSFGDYEREFGVLGEMQRGIHNKQMDLQPGEDEDTIYETPGLSSVEDIKIVNPVYRPTHHGSSVSTKSPGTSSPGGSN